MWAQGLLQCCILVSNAYIFLCTSSSACRVLYGCLWPTLAKLCQKHVQDSRGIECLYQRGGHVEEQRLEVRPESGGSSNNGYCQGWLLCSRIDSTVQGRGIRRKGLHSVRILAVVATAGICSFFYAAVECCADEFIQYSTQSCDSTDGRQRVLCSREEGLLRKRVTLRRLIYVGWLAPCIAVLPTSPGTHRLTSKLWFRSSAGGFGYRNPRTAVFFLCNSAEDVHTGTSNCCTCSPILLTRTAVATTDRLHATWMHCAHSKVEANIYLQSTMNPLTLPGPP